MVNISTGFVRLLCMAGIVMTSGAVLIVSRTWRAKLHSSCHMFTFRFPAM